MSATPNIDPLKIEGHVTQAAAISANTAKTGITTSQANAITTNTAKTGITSSQASAITANTSKIGITPAQSSAITANTAKAGITSAQASAITANTAKTGITSSQANAILVNTAKTGLTSAQITILGNTSGTNTGDQDISGIATNATNIATNVTAIALNTAKTGISTNQVNEIAANTAKVGITTAQANAIVANTSSIYGVKLKTPTETEWEAERTSWGTNNAAGAFGSVLKLPMAGNRSNSNGSLSSVGAFGRYWSSTVSSTSSRSLDFSSSNAVLNTLNRASGSSVRLIVDGIFTQNEYNSDYSTKTIEHLGLTYGFVYNTDTQKIWLDRNLGATQVATSSTDTASYGDLYQWGRPFDGHQSRTSSTHNGDTLGKPSTEYETGSWDIKFITTSTSPNDWLSVQDTSLLQNRDSMTSKTFNLQAPTASDDITIFRTDVAITVHRVITVSTGTSPSTTYQLKHSNVSRSVAGNALTTLGTTTNSGAGDVATLSDNTIPANSWIWLETTAASGTNVYLSIDIRYTED